MLCEKHKDQTMITCTCIEKHCPVCTHPWKEIETGLLYTSEDISKEA